MASATPATVYPICPVAYVRMNKKTPRTKPSVVKYNAFKDVCKRYGVVVPLNRPLIIFIMPTRQKKKWGTPARTKKRNDLDNLLKALFDSAPILDSNGVEYDDGEIAEFHAMKLWGEKGSISIAQFDPNLSIIRYNSGDLS